MLKVERQGQKIEMILQSREPLWNRPFFLAFSFALLIHASALLLFRITPIITGSKEILLAPVAVNTQIPISSDVVTDLKSNPIHYPFQPKRPDLSASWPRNSVAYHEPSDPFKSSRLPDLGYPEKPRPLTIIVSGPLAEAKLLQNNSFSPNEPLFEKYTVRVDNSSGRIFWYQSEKPPNPSAEALLKTLRFTPTNKTPFTTGYIEIAYEPISINHFDRFFASWVSFGPNFSYNFNKFYSKLITKSPSRSKKIYIKAFNEIGS